MEKIDYKGFLDQELTVLKEKHLENFLRFNHYGKLILNFQIYRNFAKWRRDGEDYLPELKEEKIGTMFAASKGKTKIYLIPEERNFYIKNGLVYEVKFEN